MIEMVKRQEIPILNCFYCINHQIQVVIYLLQSAQIVYDYLDQFIKKITLFDYCLLALMSSFDAEILNIINFQEFIYLKCLYLVLHFNYFKVHFCKDFHDLILIYSIEFNNYFLIIYHFLNFAPLSFYYFCVLHN